jgi:hypothetical protein
LADRFSIEVPYKTTWDNKEPAGSERVNSFTVKEALSVTVAFQTLLDIVLLLVSELRSVFWGYWGALDIGFCTTVLLIQRCGNFGAFPYFWLPVLLICAINLPGARGKALFLRWGRLNRDCAGGEVDC